MISLHVDDAAAIPLSVESASAVSMTVSEAFIDRGSAIQSNKNATPSTSQVVVTPDQGFDGMAKVTVAAIPSEYIIPTGTKSISANGTGIDVKAYEKVDVAVPGITPSGTLAIATNGTHDVTNYATASVAVPASAVDSGTKSITANGNGQDVVGYAAVNVNVPNSYAAADEGKVVSNGALVAQTSDTCTTNGVVDTTLINSLTVNVSGGGGLTLESALDGVIAGTITSYENPTITTLVDAMFRAYFWNKITTFKAHAVTTTQNYSMFGIGAKNVAFPNLTSLNAAFNSCAKIEILDIGAGVSNIVANAFNAANNLNTLILRRSSSIVSLAATNAFNNNHFKNGGTGGTIYIPKALYDHLGDNSSLDYKKATNWTTVNGYGTITWAAIEGSAYETQYADGTSIT